jgi:predicted DNA-binding transcriptional regulator YafY
MPQAEEQFDLSLASAFAVFTGAPSATAVLRFTAHRARCVAEETWHRDQPTSYLPGGRYQPTLPYAHSQELLMDILKFGLDCEIVSPPALRAAAIELMRRGLAQYQPPRDHEDD